MIGAILVVVAAVVGIEVKALLIGAVKARMRPTGTDVALVAAINRVEQRLRAAFPQPRWVFFEPDVAD